MTTQTVSFPGLGWEFTLTREAFSIGPFTVYWYGIIAVVAIILGILYATRRSHEFGVTKDQTLDIVLYSLIGGLIGARLYYVAFTWDYYKDHLDEIWKTWLGGLAIYGGLIGAFLVGIFLCRRWKVKAICMADLAFVPILLGQAIGRWGNFVNVEAFGSNTTLPWGMTGPAVVGYLQRHQAELAGYGIVVDPNLPVHPTFFYESMWCLIGFLLLAWYTRRRKFNGELSLLYCFWYGAGRCAIEGLRTDSLMWGRFRVSQVLAGVGALAALLAWVYLYRRAKAGTLPAYLVLGDQGKTGSPESSAIDGPAAQAVSEQPEEEHPEEAAPKPEQKEPFDEALLEENGNETDLDPRNHRENE